MTKQEIKHEVQALVEKNKRLLIKQAAWVEEVCHLRSRIDRAERQVNENDKKIKELKRLM